MSIRDRMLAVLEDVRPIEESEDWRDAYDSYNRAHGAGSLAEVTYVSPGSVEERINFASLALANKAAAAMKDAGIKVVDVLRSDRYFVDYGDFEKNFLRGEREAAAQYRRHLATKEFFHARNKLVLKKSYKFNPSLIDRPSNDSPRPDGTAPAGSKLRFSTGFGKPQIVVELSDGSFLFNVFYDPYTQIDLAADDLEALQKIS